MTIHLRKILLFCGAVLALSGCNKEDYVGFYEYKDAPLDLNGGLGDFHLGTTMMGPFLATHPTEAVIVSSSNFGNVYRFSYFGDRLAVQFTDSAECEASLAKDEMGIRDALKAIKAKTFLSKHLACAQNRLQSFGVFAVGDRTSNFYSGEVVGLGLYSSYKDMIKAFGEPQNLPYRLSAAPLVSPYTEARYQNILIYHDPIPTGVSPEEMAKATDASMVKGFVLASTPYRFGKASDAISHQEPPMDSTLYDLLPPGTKAEILKRQDEDMKLHAQ